MLIQCHLSMTDTMSWTLRLMNQTKLNSSGSLFVCYRISLSQDSLNVWKHE